MELICRATAMNAKSGRSSRPGAQGLMSLVMGLLVSLALAPSTSAQVVPGPGEEGHPCFDATNCEDNNACTVNTCVIPGVVVVRGPNGEPGVCTFVAPAPANTPCGALAGVCDQQDVCNGVSTVCPDTKKASGTVCRPAAGPCDVPDTCDGVSNTCAPDAKRPATFECGPSQGVCDRVEHCDGVGDFCPNDVKFGPDVVCRPAAGSGATCDAAEVCPGNSNDCPADG